MISQLWSASLTVIGVGGLFLVYYSPGPIGPTIGVLAQGLWIAYALATHQYPFIVSAFAYGGVGIYGLLKRLKESKNANVSGTTPPVTVCRCADRGQ